MHKHGLRTLGLSIMAALGLMAFAGVAQAATLSDGGKAGTFLVSLGTALVPNTTIGGLGTTTGTLLVAGRNLDILCTHTHVLTGSKFISSTEGLLLLLFLGCETFEHNNHAVKLPCEIPGKDIHAHAIIKPKLHEGKLFVLASGAPFTKFTYASGTGCPLPLAVEISGSVVAEVEEDSASNLVSLSEAIQKLFQSGGVGDKLLYGTFESFVNADAKAELTGAHAGLKFGCI